MKITLTKSEFVNRFDKFNRSNNFSVAGREALYDYFCELEDDTGKEIEADIIGICCEYSEYKNIAELKKNYTKIKNMDDLRDHTSVIEFDGGLIIKQF